jgi:hypothetical protein
MEINKRDYTNTFRALSKESHQLFKDELGKKWQEKYEERLKMEKRSSVDRKKAMELTNPKFILRNYLAQEAIQDAENFDYEKFNTLLELLKKPFDENSKYEDLAKAPPEWGKKLEISCSS